MAFKRGKATNDFSTIIKSQAGEVQESESESESEVVSDSLRPHGL